jgi:hypothetical protein
MKLLATVLVAIGSFLLLAMLFAYVQFAYYSPAGFQNVDTGDITKPVVLSAFSLLGIFSKGALGAVMQTRERGTVLTLLATALSPKNLVRAIVVCPLVILSLYHSLQQIGDTVLVALIAYQNGFFFESILHSGAAKKAR